MRMIDEIPTAPNSPNAGASEAAEGMPLKPPSCTTPPNYTPKLSSQASFDSMSESYDMMSSIESLVALSRRLTPLPDEDEQFHAMDTSQTLSQPTTPTLKNSVGKNNSPPTSVRHENLVVRSGLDSLDFYDQCGLTSSSEYGFVMPSLSLFTDGHKPGASHVSRDVQEYHGAPDQDTTESLVGMLSIGVAGTRSSSTLAKLVESSHNSRSSSSSGLPDTQSTLEPNAHMSVEAWVCSVSSIEQDNVVLFNVDLAPKEVCGWLVDRLRRAQPVHAVIYCVEQLQEQDIVAMLEIQKIAELIVVLDDSENGGSNNDTSQLQTQLENRGVNLRYVWRSKDNAHLFHRLCSMAGPIRANSIRIQQKWYQSQLVVTTVEPAGALSKHLNLHRPPMESIANVDPLGVAQWSSIPRVTALVMTGVASGAVAAFGVSYMMSKLVSVPEAPVTCRRHAIFDIEDWPTWLVK